jgi:transcriptional regulator with PAS, ATPase and Fis domain
MELLQVFADQAALALVNANLFEENLRRTQELRVSHEEIERLNARLKVEMERQREELAQAQQALRERAREEGPFRYSYEGIVGRSEALRRLLHLLDRIIPTPLPVLVVGESGTGKELVARALHFNGPRAAGPFVSVNCGALPEALFESELFGFERGAFTGADRGREGVIQQASGGTLFLDEIGNLSLENQKKLLRVLQEGEVRRIGGQRTIKVDVRVISATNRNLEKAIETGEFRSDLYYRICGVKVAVPALRERREDVPLLVAWALDRLAREMEQPPRAVTPAVMRALVSYSWPGNVRELMNEMRRAWALSGGAEIGPEALSPHLLQEAAAPAREPGEAKPLKQQVADLEKQAILRALRLHSGNKSRVARVLGISRLGLKKKMDRYRLEEP